MMCNLFEEWCHLRSVIVQSLSYFTISRRKSFRSSENSVFLRIVALQLNGSGIPCIVSLKKFSQAVSFLRGRGYRDVTSQIYPKMRHEILNEIGREDVWRDVRERLDSWLAR